MGTITETQSEIRAPGKWARFDIPHKGWVCVDIADLGQPRTICEMCELAVIRYVHTMSHPDYPVTIRAGRICAGRMEDNPFAAESREQNVANLMRRRANWLTRKWRKSYRGNAMVRTDGAVVVVFEENAAWIATVKHPILTHGLWIQSRGCKTVDEAKLAGFEILMRVKEVSRV